VEGYYGILKRDMTDVSQHCGEHHLRRWRAEFDFRDSNCVKLGIDDRLAPSIASMTAGSPKALAWLGCCGRSPVCGSSGRLTLRKL
jgi:hypothetical protein